MNCKRYYECPQAEIQDASYADVFLASVYGAWDDGNDNTFNVDALGGGGF